MVTHHHHRIIPDCMALPGPKRSNRGGLRNARAEPPVRRSPHLASAISSSSSVRRVAARTYM